MKRAFDTSHLVRRLRARCLDSGSGDEADLEAERPRTTGAFLVHPLCDEERAAAKVDPVKFASHMSNWFDLLRLALLAPIPTAQLLRWAAGDVPIRLTVTGATLPTVNELVRAVSSISACGDPTLLGCRAVELDRLTAAFPVGQPGPLGGGSTCHCEGRLGHVSEVDSVCPGCRSGAHAQCMVGGICRDCVDGGALPMGLFHDPAGVHWKFHLLQFDLMEPRLDRVAVDLVVARFHHTTLTRFFIVHGGKALGEKFDLPAPVHAMNKQHRRGGVLESTIVLRALVQSRATAAARREAAFRACQPELP